MFFNNDDGSFDSFDDANGGDGDDDNVREGGTASDSEFALIKNPDAIDRSIDESKLAC